MPKKARARHLF